MEKFEGVRIGVCAGFACAVQCIGAALGGYDPTLKLLVVMMILDFATGTVAAAFFKKSKKTSSGALSSAACFKGIVHKVSELLLVWLAVMIDKAVGSDSVRGAMILFLCGSEGISLLENFGSMGVPYPTFLKNALDAMRETGDGGKTGGAV